MPGDKDGHSMLQHKVRQQVLAKHHLLPSSFRVVPGILPFPHQCLVNSFPRGSRGPWLPWWWGRTWHFRARLRESRRFIIKYHSFLKYATLKSCNLETWKEQLERTPTPVHVWRAFITQKVHSVREALWRKEKIVGIPLPVNVSPAFEPEKRGRQRTKLTRVRTSVRPHKSRAQFAGTSCASRLPHPCRARMRVVLSKTISSDFFSSLHN